MEINKFVSPSSLNCLPVTIRTHSFGLREQTRAGKKRACNEYDRFPVLSTHFSSGMGHVIAKKGRRTVLSFRMRLVRVRYEVCVCRTRRTKKREKGEMQETRRERDQSRESSYVCRDGRTELCRDKFTSRENALDKLCLHKNIYM